MTNMGKSVGQVIIIIIIINIFDGRNNITCSTHCKYRTAATAYTLETRLVSVISL